MKKSINVFIAYSRKDKEFKDRIYKHLSVLERNKMIKNWYDGLISPGQEWDKKVSEALKKSKIVLLLISANFIASDYCFDRELKKALKRHKSGKSVVIPIILRKCLWKDTPIGNLQVVPKDGIPIDNPIWHNEDEGYYDVVSKIKGVAQNILSLDNPNAQLENNSINKILAKGESKNLIDKLGEQILINKQLEQSNISLRKLANERQNKLRKLMLNTSWLLNDQVSFNTLNAKLEYLKNYEGRDLFIYESLKKIAKKSSTILNEINVVEDGKNDNNSSHPLKRVNLGGLLKNLRVLNKLIMEAYEFIPKKIR